MSQLLTVEEQDEAWRRYKETGLHTIKVCPPIVKVLECTVQPIVIREPNKEDNR